MATIEKRYIRIEDWKGNIYYPESAAGATTAGVIMDAKDASTDPSSGSITYTEGLIVADPSANNATAIQMIENADPKIMFKTEVDTIPFGKVNMDIRMKSPVNTSGSIIAYARIYYIDNRAVNPTEVLVTTKNITGDMIEEINNYVNISFSFNYNGIDNGSTSMIIKLYANGNVGGTLYFDQVAICKAF